MIQDTPSTSEIDVDAREQYVALLETSKQFIGVPGGGVKVLAALIELFDVMLSKAPQDTQDTFWNYVEKKMEAARSRSSLIDLSVKMPPDLM